MNAFNALNAVDVGNNVEKKNGLSYLSWAWAWAEIKKRYPMSYYTVYENAQGLNYHTDGKTCWVKTGMTLVDGEEQLEHIEYLPVMDNRNKSIPLNQVTSFDVNKAIQRSLTKACARHGLGLYIYAGEDMPEDAQSEEAPKVKAPKADTQKSDAPICECCGGIVKAMKKGEMTLKTVEQVLEASKEHFGQVLCGTCLTQKIKEKKEGQIHE